MKFAKLIRRNLFRNKLRAILTIAAAGGDLLLRRDAAVHPRQLRQLLRDAGEGANRLVVQSAISLANLLPYAHEAEDPCDPRRRRHRQAAVDRRVLQGEDELLRQLRRRPRQVRRRSSTTTRVDRRRSWPRFRPTAAARSSARTLMKRFNWKVGDRITLKRQIFPFDPELTIRGDVRPSGQHHVGLLSTWTTSSSRSATRGRSARSGSRSSDPKQMAAISQQIDAMFKNSDYPTETFTEKEFQQNFMSMMGNVKLLFTARQHLRDLHGHPAGGDHDEHVGPRARHRNRSAQGDRLRAAPRPDPDADRVRPADAHRRRDRRARRQLRLHLRRAWPR